MLCSILLFGLLTLQFSCMDRPQQSQLQCAEVSDDRLITFPFAGTTDAVLVWIRDQYGLSSEDIKSDLSADRAQMLVKWKSLQPRTYSALLWIDAKESGSVTVRWQNQAPILADIRRCLGDPPLYSAFYAKNPETVWTYLEFWYPERGLRVTAYVPRKVRDFAINQAVTDVTYVQPGPTEELVSRFFWAVAPGSDRYAEILRELKPWPGDLKKVTISEWE